MKSWTFVAAVWGVSAIVVGLALRLFGAPIHIAIIAGAGIFAIALAMTALRRRGGDLRGPLGK